MRVCEDHTLGGPCAATTTARVYSYQRSTGVQIVKQRKEIRISHSIFHKKNEKETSHPYASVPQSQRPHIGWSVRSSYHSGGVQLPTIHS
jgi:hypothetical protein